MSPVHFEVGPEKAGERLDAVLSARPEVGSRTFAQRLIAEGRVTVDGRIRDKGHRLAGGERIDAEPEDSEPEPVPPAPHTVVFEDEHLMVVDKPPGVVVHPARGHPTGTLVQALEGRAAGGSDPRRPGIVHRLDRDTSGLLLVAKSDAVHTALQNDLRARRI